MYDLIGTLVAGRYRVESMLGTGGMGAVFAAVQEPIGRRVALKVIKAHTSEHVRKRFRREARSVARLHHPGIAQVYDFDVTPAGLHYIAMELIGGGSLAGFRGKPPHYTDVMRICDQVLAALAYTHARGVIHRDLKPENVLFTDPNDGPRRAKLVDFGIAAVLDDDVALTAIGRTVGTPVYMAPEQATAQKVGPPADLYSLGVMLYEIFGGRPPFSGRAAVEIMYAKVRNHPPALVAREGVELPPDLAEVIMRALRRNPKRRYELAADMREAIRPYLQRPELSGTYARFGGAEQAGPPAGGWSTAAVLTRQAEAQDPSRMEAPVVGRRAERRKLLHLAEQAAEGQGVVVVLEGPFGIGKTRLADWLRTRVEEEGLMRSFLGGHGQSSEGPWEGMRNVMQAAFGLNTDEHVDRVSAVRRFLRAHGEDSPDEVEALVRFTEGKVDLPNEAMPALLIRFLRRLSINRPLLIVLDDAHQAGSELQAFSEQLVLSMRPAPIPLLLLMTVDPDVMRGAPSVERAYRRLLRNEGEGLERIRPDPLEDGDVRSLIRPMVSDGIVVEHIQARARGNPLFAVELARFYGARALESGSAYSSSTWSVPRGVPDSLEEVLGLRIEQVVAAHPERQVMNSVLEAAAVLGARFPTRRLEAMLADAPQSPGPDAIADALDRLIDEGVLAELSEYSDETLEFRPVLLQERVLAGVGDDVRAALHARAAALFAGVAAPAAILERAHHLRQAGHPEAAADSYRLAAVGLHAAGSYRSAAMAELGRADVLERAGRGSEAERRRYESALMLFRVGEHDPARSVLSVLYESQIRSVRLMAKARLVSLYLCTGWQREGKELLGDLPREEQLAQYDFEPEEERRLALELLRARAHSAARPGASSVDLRSLVERGRKVEDQDIRWELLSLAATIAAVRNLPEDAGSLARTVLEESAQASPCRSRCRALGVLAGVAVEPGDEGEVRRDLLRERDTLKKAGLRGLLPTIAHALGQLERAHDHIDGALEYYREALEHGRFSGDGRVRLFGLHRAFALRDLGDLSEAREQLIEVLSESQHPDPERAMARLCLAQIELRRGNSAGAIRELSGLDAERRALVDEPDSRQILDEIIAGPVRSATELAKRILAGLSS